MKHTHAQILAFALALTTSVAIVSFEVVSGQGQSPGGPKTSGTENPSRVKPTILLTDRRTTAGETAAALKLAAENNTALRYELIWTFGGKQQHGWYLYTPLIGRLLKTEADSNSPGFALALAQWQAKSGLAQTGVLDEDSLYAMVAEWQAARIQNREIAAPESLLTAPLADFYDPERLEELRQVERQTYAAYRRMVAAAIADLDLGLTHVGKDQLAPEEKYLKIISSFRSREYQEKLRRETPNAGRAGLAVNSPHFTGRALDLYVGGEPVETKDANRAIQVQTRVYKWLVRNADRFGFRPYYYEPWHWEYVEAVGK
jgi:zinc D-Ala-D-Ala carboxypeptidase